MKSVLISIQPNWCELIVSGKKTVEVRKTKPKLETPFKCYIYCSQDIKKVIGEFVCDEIDVYTSAFFDEQEERDTYDIARLIYHSRIKYHDLCAYVGLGDFYAWHISNLVIYDKPKELNEFKRSCPDNVYSCAMCRHGDYSGMKCTPIIRPPQSWCYVLEDGDYEI